jgi:hypothetical protein
MARRTRTKSFSARISAHVVDELEAESARLGVSKSQLGERLLDEGLQMDQFPGLIFRSGPVGRRAGLAGGPDVWEVVRDLKGAAAAGMADPVSHVSEVSGLLRAKVELALSYYAAHPEDVDERIRLADEAVERVQRALNVTHSG